MKKVLIGVLILIPIIIVASVLLTTNIISKNSYLPVDRVELNENNIEFSLDNGNTIDTLKATVYPRLAKNHNLTWSIEEQHSDIPFVYAKDDPCQDCADLSDKKLKEHIDTNHIDIATIDNNGVVTVYGYGSFIVKVTTEEGNKFATCSVKVVGDKVTKIELMPYGSSSKLSENDVISMDTGERLLLNPIFTPGGARDKTVTWKSADERIVEVDKNGILSAKGAGETTISVSSNDTGIGTSVKVKVNNGVFKGESYCYTTDTTVNVKNYMNVSDFTSVKVAGGTLSSDGTLNFYENATVATVTVNGKTFSAIKVDALSDDDIVFKNYDILLQKLYNKNGDEVEYIVKRGLPIYLEVVYRNPEKSGVPEVDFSSNDIAPGSPIVNIEQFDQSGKESNVGNVAMIEPNKEGNVKILAKDRTTNKTCSTVELKVVTPVFAINLALNATDAKRGVAAETVFGNKIFNADCTETSPYSFYMDFNYPKDVDFENFEFSTSDESIAKFSDEKGSYNKLVLNDKMPDEKKGLKNKVIITIKAKYPMYDNMPVVATYVLNIIDGYTVSNETQLKKALHEKKESVAIYVKDSTAGGKLEIRADNNTDASRITMQEGTSMYGNGFIVCFNEQDMIDRKNDYFNELLNIKTSNVHVENAILRMGYNDPEAKNGLLQWEKSRRCVRILHEIENYDDEKKNNEMINNISFKYCIFENAKTVMEIAGADVNIEGCIFRNSSANSLFIPMSGNTSTYGRLPANVTLKNTVFTHSALMPICVQTDFDRDRKREDESGKVVGYPEGSTWEDMKKTGYKDHFINVEGFLDIYNWINIDEFATTGSGLIPPTNLNDALDALISQEGSKIIANVLLNDQYNDVRHTINNQEYVHLGIVVLGMTAPVSDGIIRNFENAGYSRHRVELTDNVLDTIPAWKVFGSMLKPYVRYPLYAYSYKEGNYQIGPDSEKKLDFQETGALYKNLREGRSTGSI
ncbi:MAG: Ig-like domain-containing protein [Clostridiales bacterium]|nr:Ig-like domain-containing protein [Clostridiales bacterium]MDD7054140.1 Ig-like domain-containing protein [Clostridiales bacterium]MDY5190837.1 Ig-like domain-containing protein [Eubacteriales bacterium]